MEFVALQETYYDRKLIRAGAKIASSANLAKQYPHLFKAIGVVTTKPVVPAKTETKETKKEVE